MAVGQAGKRRSTYAGEIEPLNMPSDYPVEFWLAEHRQLFGAYYRGRAVAGCLLGAAVDFYQLGEVHLRLESEGDVVAVGARPSVVIWNRPVPTAFFIFK